MCLSETRVPRSSPYVRGKACQSKPTAGAHLLYLAGVSFVRTDQSQALFAGIFVEARNTNEMRAV